MNDAEQGSTANRQHGRRNQRGTGNDVEENEKNRQGPSRGICLNAPCNNTRARADRPKTNDRPNDDSQDGGYPSPFVPGLGKRQKDFGPPRGGPKRRFGMTAMSCLTRGPEFVTRVLRFSSPGHARSAT